ncbi:MAG TPA: hypothetical protein VFE39_09195 [Pseudonocardia sp.]|nr:hypothetical protein [Pseudonocardia sp.]
MSDIRWEGYSHEEIYAAVHQGPGRSISAAAEAAWAATEALILRIDERIAAAMAQSAGGWEGSAAEATRTAMTPLGQWALDAANDAKITAQAVTTQGEQARELRNAMPEPNTAQLEAEYGRALTDPTYIFHGRDDLQAAEQESANRAARAIDLMNGYTNNSYENRSHMDYWTLPPQVTVETTAPAPPAGSGAAGSAIGAFGAGGGPGAAGVAVAGTNPAVGVGGGLSAPVAGAALPAGPAGVGPGGAPSASGTAGGGAGPGLVPSVVGSGSAGVGGGARRRAGGTPGDAAGRGGGMGPPTTRGTGSGTRGPSRDGGLAPPVGTSRPSPGGPRDGVRPVVPGPPPRGGPAPNWRDLVPAGPGRQPGAPGPWARSDEDRRLLPPGGSRAAGEPPARPPGGDRPATDPASRAGPTARTTSGHPGLYPPMTAGAAGGPDQERRRPDYLIDDTDAFADDRWFTPGVIGADDPLPPR